MTLNAISNALFSWFVRFLSKTTKVTSGNLKRPEEGAHLGGHSGWRRLHYSRFQGSTAWGELQETYTTDINRSERTFVFPGKRAFQDPRTNTRIGLYLISFSQTQYLYVIPLAPIGRNVTLQTERALGTFVSRQTLKRGSLQTNTFNGLFFICFLHLQYLNVGARVPIHNPISLDYWLLDFASKISQAYPVLHRRKEW